MELKKAMVPSRCMVPSLDLETSGDSELIRWPNIVAMGRNWVPQ